MFFYISIHLKATIKTRHLVIFNPVILTTLIHFLKKKKKNTVKSTELNPEAGSADAAGSPELSDNSGANDFKRQYT